MKCAGCGRKLVKALITHPLSWEPAQEFCGPECVERYRWVAVQEAVDASYPTLAMFRGEERDE